MALSRRSDKRTVETEQPDLSTQFARATNLLALLLVKGESQPEKIRVLSAAGYANSEIAQLLGITANTVNVALYKQRAKK